MKKFKIKVWDGWTNEGRWVELDVGTDVARRILRDPDVSPELRARAEDFLAGGER